MIPTEPRAVQTAYARPEGRYRIIWASKAILIRLRMIGIAIKKRLNEKYDRAFKLQPQEISVNTAMISKPQASSIIQFFRAHISEDSKVMETLR